jgi:hypothetical protein
MVAPVTSGNFTNHRKRLVLFASRLTRNDRSGYREIVGPYIFHLQYPEIA